MKTLYLECNMGAAGDMLMAALLELHPDPQDFLARLNGLGIPGVRIAAEKTVKCGIAGTRVVVAVDGAEEESVDAGAECGHAKPHEHHAHSHSHTSLEDIMHRIGHFDLQEETRTDIAAVYRLLAEAESHAHRRPVDQIHFHEVGTMDALADVTGVCMLMRELSPERILASPVHVGSGQVRCAHGILPVPAPATAWILRGVPIYGGTVRGELCTPTGAALLKYFVNAFGPMPVIRVDQIGYGMGAKDFEAANCVRAMLGEGQARP